MKKLNLKSKLKKAANVLAGIFTFATVAGGISALATTVINPVDLWWSIAPIEIAYFNYVITYTMVIEYLEFLQTYYWYSVGASSGAIVLGLAAQIRSIAGLKKVPMAIVRSPITLYQDVKNFRDWCSIVNHSNCKQIISTITGGVYPAFICGTDKINLVIIDNLNLVKEYGYDPSWYNDCINFTNVNKNIINYLPSTNELLEIVKNGI